MKNWRIIYYLAPLAILAALVVWRLAKNEQAQAAQSRAAQARRHAPVSVEAVPVVDRDIVHVFSGIGNVEAPLSIKIAPKITGRLDYLEVREGAHVTRGEVLARLDPSEAQAVVSQQEAAVGSARANLANAETFYRRYYSLYRQGFIAAQDVDNARTQAQVQRASLAAAEAQLRNVRAQLGDTVLRAPIDGFVTARSVDPGSVVGAGQQVVTVEAIRRVYVTTAAPETVGEDLHPGMLAAADFDALPGRTFRGRLTQVDPAADPQSREFLVRALLDNPRGTIRPGMYGRVTVVTKVTRGATVVPFEAVQHNPQGAYVTVVDASRRARRVPVRTGDSDQGGVAIVGQVHPGDLVVTLSPQPVREGQVVRLNVRRQSGGASQPAEVSGAGMTSAPASQSGVPAAPTYASPGGGVAAGQIPGSAGSVTATTGFAPGSGTTTSGGSPAATSTTPQTYNGAPGVTGTNVGGTGAGGAAPGGTGPGTPGGAGAVPVPGATGGVGTQTGGTAAGGVGAGR